MISYIVSKQVQVNLAKDVLRKVENNFEQHEEYEKNLKKAREWLENAKEIIRESSTSSATASKEVLQQRLDKIQVQKSYFAETSYHITPC